MRLIPLVAVVACATTPRPREPAAPQLAPAGLASDTSSQIAQTANPAPVAPTETFAIVRACNAVTAAASRPAKLASVAAKPRKLVKIGPLTNQYQLSPDLKEVVYQDPATSKWMAVAPRGGAPRATTMPVAVEPLAHRDVVRPTRAPGYIVMLSSRYGLEVDGDSAGPVAIDTASKTIMRIAPDGVGIIWLAQRMDDQRGAFIGRNRHMYVADLDKRELSCASLEAPRGSEIFPFFSASPEGYLAYTTYTAKPGSNTSRDFELHIVDLARGVDATVATVSDAYTVVFAAIPGRPAFVAHVQFETRDRMAFYEIDATTSAVSRVTDELPGWSSAYVTADHHVIFSRGRFRSGSERPPKPESSHPTDDDRGGTCDPIDACVPGVCGWQSNHCNDHVWCGPCESSRPKPPPRNHGLYSFKL